jgi:hypothetical protein
MGTFEHELTAEQRQAIKLYEETCAYLATHNIPEHHYDFLVEQCEKIHQAFTTEDLLQYIAESRSEE